ncbi:MAG TPA: cytochrome c biogenesis protein CcsA [Coriobacteriia bacterium]
MVLAFIGTLVSLVALIVGDRMGAKDGERATNVGYIAALAVAGLVTIAIVVMALAFLREDLTFRYVAENRPNIVSAWAWVYKLSGVWAGREGSFLFWSWLLGLFTAWIAWKRLQFTDRLTSMALVVMNVVQGMFLMLLLTPANSPFLKVIIQGTLALDPATNQPIFDTATQFMSPLLQTWAMVIHPPTLFIGYAGLTVPFAYAIASLIVNDPSKKWIELSDRITVFSWLLLGAGIGLGAIWAYYELAFGGFWAWDPVENASFLPWLTGVALVHSFTVYRKRGTFKAWSIMLSALTFAMVILGTFITRSGALAEGASVHTFGGDPWAYYILLTMIVGSVGAAGIGYYLRRRTFASREEYEGLLTKEASYEFNNVIMTAMALLIAYMTLSSAVPSWLSFLPGAGKLIAKETYELISRPIGIIYLAVMVICPVLSWRKTEPATFWRRVKWPLAIGSVLFAAFVALWATALLPNYTRMAALPGGTSIGSVEAYGVALVGLLVAAFAIALPLYLYFDGAKKRAAAKGEGFGSALLSIMTKARTQSGGYLTHLGMGIILFGLVGSTMFVDRVQANLPATGGGTVAIQDWSFKLDKVTSVNRPNGDLEVATVLSATKGGAPAGTYAPAMILPKQMLGQTDDPNSGRKDVAIIREPMRDVFVTFSSWDGSTAGMDIRTFPLISFTWGGFLVLMIGSALASWPKRAPSAA